MTTQSITQAFYFQFVTLLVILSPFDTIPIYLNASGGLKRRESLIVAFYAVAIAFLVLLFFIVAGDLLLEGLQIPMENFQLAGGLILFVFGLKMVLEEGSDAKVDTSQDRTLMQRAIFPLAIPSIASPGAIMAAVLMTDNARFSASQQSVTAFIVVLCLLVNFLVFSLAGTLNRFLGKAGIEIITRVFGLILASNALTNAIEAVKTIIKSAS